MRRGVGISAVLGKKVSDEKFMEKHSKLDESSIDELQEQLGHLQEKLQWFAAKHQKTLKRDPLFRKEFTEMCANIGVDPLASSKGFWTKYLGLGTFYYQLAVQAIEKVLSGADHHGGIVRLDDLWKQMRDSRSPYLEDSSISSHDLIQAFRILDVLGPSCGVIRSNAQIENSLVFCVPEELSSDSMTIIQHIAESGKAYYTVADLEANLGWPRYRAMLATEKLLRDGIVWKDCPPKARDNHRDLSLYWFPGLFLDLEMKNFS